MMRISITSLLILLFMTSCTKPSKNQDGYIGYHNRDYKIPGIQVLSPEALWSLGRIGETTISPDKNTIIFTTTWYSINENKGYGEIYSLPTKGGKVTQLTNNPEFYEYNIQWRPDGKKIGYISNKSGSSQLWEMNPDGTKQTIVSNIKGGIKGFKYAPDMSKIAFIKSVNIGASVKESYPDLQKANAKIIDDLMYRHWDSWVDKTFDHLFIADYTSNIYTIKDIMPDEPWETPVRPFGGMEQITWSPDSKTIIYTCRKKEGKEYALSTNTDLYAYEVPFGTTKNITEGMMGYDKNPTFSPSGDLLAFESMERDGYEADVNRLVILNMTTNEKYIYKNSDINVNNLVWDTDESILFISDWHARDHIYSLEVKTEKLTKITDGDVDYQWFSLSKTGIIASKMSISTPTEIYTVDKKSGIATELSFVNKPILDQITMGKVEERWVKTTDNKEELVWVIYPPNFDPSKKYPTLLYCQGGPQGTVSQFWSYRWNFQLMAANGYIVVAPNRRGLPGFGKEWNEQISGDYGGQNMKDYLSAIDALAKEPYVDDTKLGAVGASYGGYSVYWLAGNHNKRFKAFIAHDGMFHFESMYLETEEMWFVNWDMGGPFWEKDNATAQKSYKASPHNFIDKWDTPILVVQGGKDYRVTESQAFMAFNAAKLRGIPAKLLYFPEENHWVTSAQNGILWQRTFFEWLQKWVKDGAISE